MKKLFLNEPFVGNLEKKYLNDVINSSWLSINGKHTIDFENSVKKYFNRKFSLAVQSGTAAVHASLKALGVKRNTPVILPNYTCVSNLSAVSQLGGKPIIVEVEKDTLGLDYENVLAAIKKYKPKVLQIVHVYGFPARDTLKIIKLCKKLRIKVLEDCSESIGSKISNKKIGEFGDISIFSIRSEKMIGVGEGGVVMSSDKKIFNDLKLICSRHSPFRSKKDPYWKKYFCNGEGYNYLMPHLLGAVAKAQFSRFENKILKKKIEIGKYYNKKFQNGYFETTQKILHQHKPVFWLNSIKFKSSSPQRVQAIGNYLIKNNIEVRSGFWPMSKLKYFKSKLVDIKNQKTSEKVFDSSLVLPSSIFLKKKQIDDIYKLILNKFF